MLKMSASRALLKRTLLAATLALLAACAPRGRGAPLPVPSAGAAIHLLHFNDVYEITPVEGGKSGGLARVAALRRTLRDSFPSLITTLGGDFLSPSALGTARVGGERLGGRQMVTVLNAVGLDVAVLGNHEFDVSHQMFLDRLALARFTILGANVADSAGRPFPNVVPHTIRRVTGPSGPIRIAFFGVVIPSNPQTWVRYSDPIETAKKEAALLRDSADVIVALTHLSVDADGKLATEVPQVDLILGGHEHENFDLRRGPRLVPVLKGDANVRSVMVVRIEARGSGAPATISSHLVPINESIAEDTGVAREVARWVDTAFAAFERDGFRPRELVARTTLDLDGREATVRNSSSTLTDVIGAAMRREVPDAEVTIFNGGSIRIDDVIPAGALTQYDVIRILPFGGRVVAARMQGLLLKRVLAQGERNAGTGGFLLPTGVGGSAASGFIVGGAPIDDARMYRIAISDFLLTGNEVELGFLKRDAPGVEIIGDRRDIRQAVIDELRSRWPPGS
jgi:5'-nucleotidase / UDP-sugar diphosphatase